jgi:hypothetical protein
MPSNIIKTLIVCLCAMGLTVFSQGCSKKATPPEWTWIQTPMAVDSIGVGQVDSTGAGFIVRAWWHDGCGRLSHNSIVRNGNSYSVAIWGEEYINHGTACSQVMTSFRVPVAVTLPGPGTFTFRFWRTDSTTLDTTLTVP